ncbi:hypothetical protein HAV15_009895 [Penicillium sp. str. |nr:hypothetical protein HAV15_009895 [Penicillium sp. str. \
MCPTRAPNSELTELPSPGTSVRLRTAAELTAAIRDQVEDTSFLGLDINGLPLMRNFLTSLDNKFRDLHPERTELDWKNGTRRPVKFPAARRSAQGQLCGVEAPANQECTSSKPSGRGHVPIASLWEQATNALSALIVCMCRRGLSRPWLNDSRQAQCFPHTIPQCIQMLIGISLMRRNPILNVTPAGSNDADEENPPKRRKFQVGPVNPGEGAAKDAPLKLKNGGLPFNPTWYKSPLEDPKVYGTEDKAYALDTYRDLADIIARVTEDHARMKEAMLEKGFLSESDDQKPEEENVFAVE